MKRQEHPNTIRGNEAQRVVPQAKRHGRVYKLLQLSLEILTDTTALKNDILRVQTQYIESLLLN